jgi:hypothetical protein
VITAIEPNEVIADSPSTTLAVFGSGFVAPVLGPTPSPGSIVRIAGNFDPLVLPTTFVSSSELEALLPGTGSGLTRAAVVRMAILGQLTEQGITAFLNSTGQIFCSFADVTCPGSSGPATDSTGVAGDWRYIETAYRLGYGIVCSDMSSGLRRFCPTLSADVLGAPGVIAVTVLNPSAPFAPVASNVVDFLVYEQPIAAPGPTGVWLLALALALAGAGWVALRSTAAR